MKIKKILNSTFGRAIILLSSGSAIAQLLTIIASSLFTRLFSPEQLAIYTLVLTVESLFGNVICGRYDICIVSEAKEELVYPLIKLCLTISIFLSIIISASYGVFWFFNSERYDSYLIITIVVWILLLMNGLIRVFEAYNNRLKEYKIMTSVYVLRTFVQNIGAVLMGLIKLGVSGLILPHTLGLLFGLGRQSKSLKPHFKDVLKARKKDMKKVMVENYKQPLYSVPAVFANRFSYSSVTFFVESLFGLKILGFYSISYKVLGLPLSVLSNNVAKVFYKEAADEYNKTGRFINSFKRTSLILLCLSIPMVLGMYFLAPLACGFVFGSRWGVAGTYIKILAPMFGIRFIVNTIAFGLQVVRQLRLELVLQSLFVVMSVICFIIAKIYVLSMVDYLMCITILFSCIYVLYYVIVWKFAIGYR